MNKKQVEEALRNWTALNEVIVKSDETTCEKLLEVELSGKARKMFILRIHSRINRLRADRERTSLKKRVAR